MSKYHILLEEYLTPKRIHKGIYHALYGGIAFGGTSGSKISASEFPSEDGNVTLTVERTNGRHVRKGGIPRIEVTSSTPAYSITCNFPEEATTWYLRLDPELSVWDAPINNFEVEILDESLEEKAKKLFAIKTVSDLHM